MKEEIWKPIKGFEAYYEVSNLGRVRSLNYNHTGKTKILKTETKNRGGYTKVHLRYGRNIHTVMHRLVAEAFIPNPENKPLVLHKVAISDGGDNSVDNLYWGTTSDNMQDKIRDGHWLNPREGKFGKDNPTCKAVDQYDLNGNFIRSFDSVTEAACSVGLPYRKCSAISNVCKGIYKTSHGYIWKYKDLD